MFYEALVERICAGRDVNDTSECSWNAYLLFLLFAVLPLGGCAPPD